MWFLNLIFIIRLSIISYMSYKFIVNRRVSKIKINKKLLKVLTNSINHKDQQNHRLSNIKRDYDKHRISAKNRFSDRFSAEPRKVSFSTKNTSQKITQRICKIYIFLLKSIWLDKNLTTDKKHNFFTNSILRCGLYLHLKKQITTTSHQLQKETFVLQILSLSVLIQIVSNVFENKFIKNLAKPKIRCQKSPSLNISKHY